MKKQELLVEIKDALQRKGELTEDMMLSSIEEWDSLSVLTVISMFDRLFSVVINVKEIAKFKTVGDLIKVAEDKLD
jgi:acyl carrier protein